MCNVADPDPFGYVPVSFARIQIRIKRGAGADDLYIERVWQYGQRFFVRKQYGETGILILAIRRKHFDPCHSKQYNWFYFERTLRKF